jgi:hypothetical protein
MMRSNLPRLIIGYPGNLGRAPCPTFKVGWTSFSESDHFVLEAVIKILAQHPKKEVVEKTHRYDKPTPSQWTQYNEDIKSCLVDEVRFDLKILLAALQQSEEKNLDRTPPEKRKPYLTRQTWEKIQERNRLRCNKAPETEVRKLSKEIAELAKRDKQESLMEQPNEIPVDHSKKGLWKAVRSLKKTPQYVRMKKMDNQQVLLTRRSETIATYLAKTHGTNSTNTVVMKSQ